MTTDNKFRSLSKRAADCQRHIGRLHQVDSLRVREEVAALIRAELREYENEIKNVRLLAEQEDDESSKLQILNRLREYESQLRQLQTSSRTALLESKQRIDALEKKMRQELFGGFQPDGTEQYELKQRNRGQDNALLHASSEVTEALRRTSKLMQQELEKSAYSASMLANSSRTLNATYTEYQNFGSLLNISKRLISQLEADDWLDRLALLFGLALFFAVALYIIKKRTWDVGISWVSWISGKALRETTTMVTATTTTTTATVATTTMETMTASLYTVKDEL